MSSYETLNNFLQNDHISNFRSVYPGERRLPQGTYIVSYWVVPMPEEQRKWCSGRKQDIMKSPPTVQMATRRDSGATQSSCFLSVLPFKHSPVGLCAGAFLQCWGPAAGKNLMLLKGPLQPSLALQGQVFRHVTKTKAISLHPFWKWNIWRPIIVEWDSSVL